MGLYNVIAPCLVNGLHYVNPTKQPIEVDDDQAKPLVESGSLEPYGVLSSVKSTERDLSGDFVGAVNEVLPEGVSWSPPEASPGTTEPSAEDRRARRDAARSRKSDPDDAA